MKERLKKWLRPALFTLGGALAGLGYYALAGYDSLCSMHFERIRDLSAHEAIGYQRIRITALVADWERERYLISDFGLLSVRIDSAAHRYQDSGGFQCNMRRRLHKYE